MKRSKKGSGWATPDFWIDLDFSDRSIKQRPPFSRTGPVIGSPVHWAKPGSGKTGVRNRGQSRLYDVARPRFLNMDEVTGYFRLFEREALLDEIIADIDG